MKKHAKKCLLALLLAICLLASACSGSAAAQSPSSSAPQSQPDAAEGTSAASAPGDETTVVDMMGHTIELDGPVESVVVLTAAECEILYALGAGDKVVGRGEYCDYPAEALDIPSVGSGSETNVEEILALAPDVIFMNSMDQSLEQIEQLEASGIPVVVSTAADIEGVYTSIGLIGGVMGLAEEADTLVADMKAAFEALAQQVPDTGGEPPTAYFEVSPLEYGLWTAGGDTFMDEITTMLGAENCFADTSGWVEISEEQVIERSPDFIFTITMYLESDLAPAEEILQRSGWGDITAVREGQVYEIGQDELSRPGPRLVEGAQQLFDKMYGTAPAGASVSGG